MDTNKINHISLCSGYGGIDIALRGIFGERIRTVAYVEIEAFAIENLVAKMEEGKLDAAPIWSNLKTFNWSAFRGLVDIMSGGYPCQPFSAAGKRLGAEDPRHLWPYIRAGIDICRPGRCFFENVDGHVSMGLSSVVSDLEEMGYEVSWGVFSAAEVGAPHQRKRVFIMADSQQQGSQGFAGNVANRSEPGRDREEKDRSISESGLCRWPARPGQEQFDWEPPRVC